MMKSDLIHDFDASNSGTADASFGEFTNSSYGGNGTPGGDASVNRASTSGPSSNNPSSGQATGPAWVFVFHNATVMRHGGAGGPVNVTVTVVVDARTNTPLLMNADG